ncbi:branched-chain amino acid ABC transporter permease [Fodinisporobacter ferrooxydans]|uniref:Branched-chain amino acid ABC transporter permease n=1 Tax=Fodinisporobacter ferrooxydans TaxID=2901836 RepID=A0ABY4CJ11_9BACL|nr:branched-chain amino acid ABC transporter permease [Alicyclobacillaceae bacterium MYW30-H2]
MKFRNRSFWLWTLVAIVIYAIGEILIDSGVIDNYSQSTLMLICINIILATSLNLINGFTGQFSIGHAGFMSIGAYLSTIATLKLNLPFGVGLLIGAIVAAIAGLLVGVPSLRLKGDYLAIATLGFGEIIRIIFLNTPYVGGASGMSGIPQDTTWAWAFFSSLITVIFINNFVNSRHGRACISVRENEIAAEAMGINTTKYKVMAFVIGSFFAGLAGGLSAHYFYIIQPTNFNFMKSFEILVIVVLGGLGSTSGSILGAILLTLLFTYLADYPEIRMIVYSLILILTMIFRPQGLMGTKEFSFRSLKLTKRGKSHGTAA